MIHNTLVSQRNAYGQILLVLAGKNEKILSLTGDLASSTRLISFSRKYPERFFNIGVAEQNAIGVAAGLALEGFIPFLSSFAVFLPGRCFDQIRVSICQNKANVKLIGSHLGFSNTGDGATAQSVADLALMRSLPDMTVLSPIDAVELKEAITAMAKLEGPAYLRMSRAKTPIVTKRGDFKLGEANILQKGKKATLVGTGPILAKILPWLEKQDIEIINSATIKPLDEMTIKKSARKTGRVLTLEEHSVIGGLGAAVSNALSDTGFPVRRIGIPDVFGESARSSEKLYAQYNLDEEGLIKTIKDYLEDSNLG